MDSDLKRAKVLQVVFYDLFYDQIKAISKSQITRTSNYPRQPIKQNNSRASFQSQGRLECVGTGCGNSCHRRTYAVGGLPVIPHLIQVLINHGVM